VPKSDASPLDELDHRLIQLLAADGRASYTWLAEELGVAAGTVRNRLQRLLDQQVIQIAAYPNPNRDEHAMRAFIGLHVDSSRLHEITRALARCIPVRYLAVSTGVFDLVALTEFPSRSDMLNFITDTIGSIEGIESVQSLVLLSVVKSLGTVITDLNADSAT